MVIGKSRKKSPEKMNENISKLMYKYVKFVLKNTLKLHKKSFNIKNRNKLTYLYNVYILIYIFNFQVP